MTMNRRAKSLRKYNSLVVCALAYAIAIQAALLGYVAASMAGPGGMLLSPAALCADRDRGDTPLAPTHNADMPCCVAVCGAGSASLPVERSSFRPPAAIVTTDDAPLPGGAEFVEWPSERPKSSRAPPL
jgi:hypothetical protein